MPASLVTALMPVKNYQPAYLAEAIRSMTAQSHPEWRLLIIVEPAGRDSIAEVLRMLNVDERITLCVNDGRGLAGAFNTGMRQASTPFVAILLADDAWEPDAIAILTANIERHPGVDFFHSSRIIVDDSGRPISSVHQSRERWTRADFVESSPVKHLLCWRRSKGLEVGGMDETLNSIAPDDYDFPWTMADAGAVFHAIPECLYRYRDHRAHVRLTTDVPLSTHLRMIWRILKKHGATPAQARAKLWAARRTYLKQCLYRTPIDKWIRERWIRRRPAAWRDTYR